MIQNIKHAEFDTTMEVIIYRRCPIAAVHLEKYVAVRCDLYGE